MLADREYVAGDAGAVRDARWICAIQGSSFTFSEGNEVWLGLCGVALGPSPWISLLASGLEEREETSLVVHSLHCMCRLASYYEAELLISH